PAHFFLMIPPPPTSTLFPYTTLFRSFAQRRVQRPVRRVLERDAFEQDLPAVDELQQLRSQELVGWLVVGGIERTAGNQPLHDLTASACGPTGIPSGDIRIRKSGTGQRLPLGVGQF